MANIKCNGNIESIDVLVKRDLIVDGNGTVQTHKIITEYSKASNFIKFENGIMICWGIVNTSKSNVVSLPQAYKDATYQVVGTYNVKTGAWESVCITSQTNTGFVVSSGETNNSYSCRYLTIGYWK